ncbi:hypothetical protein KI387_041879 [Taxus chinensis]|uniref:Uncharacterized protein n=1 Tax=Taxus chinensis TaxID=29808 RepID=A0AA38C2S5_TAXCH|nr:hypothetical protein KI387_041879 [Taxus chinensis]
MSNPQYLRLPSTFSPPGRPCAYLCFSRLTLIISGKATPDEAVQEKRERRHNAMRKLLLKECGFSLSQLQTLINRDPCLFRFKTHHHRAEQALQLFIDSGFTSDQVLTEKKWVVSYAHQPRVLSCSLQKNLAPKILFFQKLFGSRANLCKALRRAPILLLSEIATLERKLKDLQRIGLLKHEVEELFLKDPLVLYLSIEKLQKNMDFLTNTAGFRPNIVLTYIQLLNFNVEKRVEAAA